MRYDVKNIIFASKYGLNKFGIPSEIQNLTQKAKAFYLFYAEFWMCKKIPQSASDLRDCVI